MINNDFNNNASSYEESNFRDILDGYLRYWKWFLFAASVALICAILYLRFTPSSYIAFSTVIIEGEESKGPTANSSAFTDLGMFSGLSTSSIENELGLFRSKRLMNNAIKALNFNIKYFALEGIPKEEIYKKSPYLVRIIRLNEKKLPEAIEEGRNNFIITKIKGENQIKLDFENFKDINKSFGEVINLGHADVVIEQNENLTHTTNDKFKSVEVQFVPVASEVSSYQSKLNVELVDENSTLIQLSLTDNVKNKAEDILNQLVFQYNQEAIEDKNLIARNTAFFIDERLGIINAELDSVESGKEEFKESNRLTDIQAESSLIIQDVSEYNRRQQDVNTELELTNAMIDHLGSNSNGLLPTDIGINESGTTQLIDEYNTLVLERDRLLKGAGEQNPRVLALNDQINQIKNNVNVSLDRRQSNLVIARDNLRRQAGILGSQISEVPGQEREFRGIERQQNIKEALYLFLLRKREENSLSLAAKAPKAKLVDQAYSIDAPIAPNPKIILAVSLLAGIFLPFLVINIINLLNNKVRDREDLNALAKNIPIVSEIPNIAKNKKDIIEPQERSVLSEAFDILSANLLYFNNDKPKEGKGKSIFFTSSIMGEGKTFSAINLAITYASSGHNVLVVGADLRNPQLTRYIRSEKDEKGLTDYLSGHNNNLDELILETELHHNLQILHSGAMPPNPTALLRNSKMDELFNNLKDKYDFIIVDTAPAMLIADTFIISKHADLTLYVVRAGFTKKKALEFASEAVKEGKLKNVGLVLNDVPLTNASYGYSYGSLYGATT